MLSYIEYYIYMRVFTFFSIIVVCCSEYLLVGHLSNLVGRLPMSDSSLQHKIQKISAAGVLPELNKLRLRQIGQNSGSGTPAPVHSTSEVFLRGSGGMLPRKIFKFRVSAMPFPGLWGKI